VETMFRSTTTGHGVMEETFPVLFVPGSSSSPRVQLQNKISGGEPQEAQKAINRQL
jgi:hypothetical protein